MARLWKKAEELGKKQWRKGLGKKKISARRNIGERALPKIGSCVYDKVS